MTRFPVFRLAFLMCLCIGWMFCPLSAAGLTRRALVIGLGEQQDKAWSKINGDRDVPMVQQMLRRSGFSDIRTLVNQQATKAGIVRALQTLGSDCQAGDVVYVHFSGHGQQMTDLNGDETDG